jgi:ferrous iron transport protein B
MTIQFAQPTIVLVGLESVGKSALFRNLTGEAAGDESNFRGSTVRVRSGALPAGRLVDTTGIRVQDDSETTRLALRQVGAADTILLVVRGTHLQQEVTTLVDQLGSALQGHRVALAVTFADRTDAALQRVIEVYHAQLAIPVALVNARQMTPAHQRQLLTVIEQAAPLSTPSATRSPIRLLPAAPVVEPQRTIFEQRWLAPWLAVLALGLLFALPVYLAYRFADWAQPVVDAWVIDQTFILVYLASTFTACLVPLWTIRSELGWRSALVVAGRQAATALVSTAMIALLVRG